jgi:DNA polymerase-3 subunit gamma/tau
LLKIIEARDAVSIDTVLKQIQQLRSGSPPASRPAAAPSPKTASKPASAPSKAPATAATTPEDLNLRQLWTGLVEAVGRASPFVNSYFKEAHPVSFAKNILTIGFESEFADHLPLVDNPKNHALVQTKLAEMGFPHAQVKFIQDDAPPEDKIAAPSPAPAPAAQAASVAEAPKPAREPAPLKKEEFKNDPLIQKALEIFKGQIVEVRS